MGKLFEELKRRKVFRVAAVYAVVAWVLIQVSDVVLPTFEAPPWVNQSIIFLFILGFLPTLIAAWAYEITPEGVKQDAGNQVSTQLAPPQNQGLLYATFGLVLLVAGFQIADRFLLDSNSEDFVGRSNSDSAFESNSIRANLILGESQVDPNFGVHGRLALSPDGQTLVYTNATGVRQTQVSVQSLEDGRTRPLTAANIGPDLDNPVFSPSGEKILVRNVLPNADDELFVVNLDGSNAEQVATTSGGAGWLSEQFLFHGIGDNILETIPLEGGEPEVFTIPMPDQVNLNFVRPIFDTRWILYGSHPNGERIYETEVGAFNLDTGQVKTLIRRAYNFRVSPSGHIIFMRDGDLWAAPVDRESIQIIGNEVLIESGIEHHSSNGTARYTFSNNGRLLYRPGVDGFSGADTVTELSAITGEPFSHSIPMNAAQGRFSPAGDQIVFTVPESDSTILPGNFGSRTDIEIYDIAEQLLSRRTFTGNADRPLWSPDGRQIVYRTRDNGGFGLWIMNADGSGQPEQLLSSPVNISATTFSADGSQLIFSQGQGTESKIVMLSLTEIENPIQDLFPANEYQDTAEISPDGRWIVYGSDEDAGRRIFVRPFPNVEDGKWLVANIDGREAHWGADDTLYFQGTDSMIYRVNVDSQNGFRAGRPEALFRAQYQPFAEPNFNVSPDGSQILYTNTEIETVVEADTLVLVENWFDRLNDLAPPNQN